MNRIINIGLILIISAIFLFIGFIIFGIIATSDRTKPLYIYQLHDGDIIFQTSKSSQSKAIQLATKSKYSHMGMIYKKDAEIYVLEAVQPVKLTHIDEWINRGYKRQFVVKRLKDSDSLLTSETIQKMKQIGDRFIGKSYDIYFEWSDNKIYCSELVWKIYKESANIEIGKLQTLKDFDLTNKIVRQKLVERYGNYIPLNETVISPISIFDSEKLVTIYKE